MSTLVVSPIVGKLTQTPLPELFRTFYLDGKSGTLDLQYEKEQRRVYFLEGEVKSAVSNDIGQKVGQHLKKAGLVLDRHIAEALEKQKDGLRFGRALIEVGAIDRETLEQQLRKLVAEIIYGAFSWPDGVFRFLESDDPVPADVMLSLSTANVIMEAIRRIPSDGTVEAAIGDFSARLRLTPDPFLRLQHITLMPDEGFFVSRIDGSTSAENLLKLAVMPRERAIRLIYGLIATGIVEEPQRTAVKPRSAEPGNAAAGIQPGSGKSKAKAHPALRSLNVQIAPKRTTNVFLAPQKPKPPNLVAEEIEYRRKKIAQTSRRLSSMTANELLEVPLNPTFREVRMKYNDLAEIYHPDLAFRPEFADLKPDLVKIFRKLREAYRTMAERSGGSAIVEAEG